MKKVLSIVISIMLIAMLQISVFGAVLEIDTSSPEFKADTWQNNVGNTTSNEVCPLINALETTSTTTNSGIDGMDIMRYTASLQAGGDNIEGALVFVNGSATSSVVFPLKETATVDSISLKFNNGERQFFLTIYTSIDGQNWTEVDVSSGANKVTLDNSFDESGAANGPGGINCYATVPAGSASDGDINIITLGIANSPETKYVKMTLYGNDGASGTSTVSNQWWSFNSLKIEGDIAVAEVVEVAAETAAEVTSTPVQTAPSVTAPQTSDAGMYIFIMLSILCLAGVITFAKKQSN